MANAITFNFESHPIHSVTINNEPWFFAKDVCKALEIDITQTRKLDPDERGLYLIQTLSGKQEVSIVSESGMYALALRCRNAMKPGTLPHRFRKWVTREVLPSIRKTGSYSVAPTQQPYDANSLTGPDLAIAHAVQTLIERARYLVGFWHQYGPAIRMLNSNVADGVYDCFWDADWSSGLLARKLGIPIAPREYFQNYPFDKDSLEKHQYYLAHSRA